MAAKRPMEGGQLAFELGHTVSLAESDFIVGDGNRMAHAHLMAYPNWPGPLVLLVGPAKAGKSHLARIWADRAGARRAEPEELGDLSGVGGTTPLVVEDIDRRGYDEAALFHLLNQAMRDGRPLLMTARNAIANWPFRTDDLKSRARLAAYFAVSTSDDIHLSQMLVKLFGDRQIAVDPKIIAYVVARMERSPEEAVVLAGMMDRMALERGTAITRAIAAEALAQRGATHDDNQLELDLSEAEREGESDE